MTNEGHLEKDIVEENYVSKIMIDLDVMLAAYGKPDKPEKKEKSIKLLREVKAGKHELYTPYTLMDIVTEFDIEYFRRKIVRFFAVYSAEIISIEKVNHLLENQKIDAKALKVKLAKIGVKEEDSLLAIVASLFNIELKTFNKKHLLNKRDAINKILKEEKLNEIKITEP